MCSKVSTYFQVALKAVDRLFCEILKFFKPNNEFMHIQRILPIDNDKPHIQAFEQEFADERAEKNYEHPDNNNFSHWYYVS